MSQPVQTDEITQALGTGALAVTYLGLKNLFQYLGSYWMIRWSFYGTVIACSLSVLRIVEKIFKILEKKFTEKKPAVKTTPTGTKAPIAATNVANVATVDPITDTTNVVTTVPTAAPANP